jgi:hypothetical protein
MAEVSGSGGDIHQQTGFTAGTVTDDDKLSADLSHCWNLRLGEVWMGEKKLGLGGVQRMCEN